MAAATRAAGGADFRLSRSSVQGPQRRSNESAGTVGWDPYVAHWFARPTGQAAARDAEQAGVTLEKWGTSRTGEVRVVNGAVYKRIGGPDGIWSASRLDRPGQTPGNRDDSGSPEQLLVELSSEPWVWDEAADGRLHAVLDYAPTYVAEVWVTIDDAGRASRIVIHDKYTQTWGDALGERELELSGWGRKPAPEPVPEANWG